MVCLQGLEDPWMEAEEIEVKTLGSPIKGQVKKNPNRNLIDRLEPVPSAFLYTASICVMELRYSALRMGNRLDLWRKIQERIISKVRIQNTSLALPNWQ